MQKPSSLRVRISTLLLVLILVTSVVVGGLGYKLARDTLELTVDEVVDHVSRDTSENLQQIIAPSELSLKLVDQSGLVQAKQLEERLEYLPFLRTVLESSATLSAVYVGYDNGDFFLVRHIHGTPEPRLGPMPAETHYLVQSIEQGVGAPRGRYMFFDERLHPLGLEDRADYGADYDPRKRVWFQEAVHARGQIRTAPYLFFATQTLGMTLAQRSERGAGVVGENILLETLNETLKAQKATPGMQIALVNREGGVFAHENALRLVQAREGARGPYPEVTLPRLEELGVPILAVVGRHVEEAGWDTVQNLRMSDGDQTWSVSILPLSQGETNPSFIVTAIPDAEFFASGFKVFNGTVLLTILAVTALIAFTWWVARVISRSLASLTREAESILHFEFSEQPRKPTIVLEVDELARVMSWMKSTIRRFMDITLLVSAEQDFETLLSRLLKEMLSTTQAEGGIFYFNGPEGLVPASALLGNGEPFPGALAGGLHTLAAEAETPEQLARLGPLMGRALNTGRVCEQVLEAEDVACLGLEHHVDPATLGHRPVHAIAVPLLNRRQHLVGAMLLLVGHEASDPARVSFIEALSGFAAGALEIRDLLRTQKALFEAFVQLLAGAVDAKSPYTGAHCSRIPELTKMLAQAACEAKTGPFRDFSLTEDEWQAVDIAAWLHDCGKITTPEFVVDKATKLETIYNRIHEVRMRFEVMKREAEIRMLKAVLAGADRAEMELALIDTLKALDEDFEFVAACNQGEEGLPLEAMERLKRIAERTWTRTLSDRLGLSFEECRQRATLPEPELPVEERVLADKPEHCIERRREDRIEPDNPWGFKMQTPDLLYNRGELYNLSIRCGTLTEEERYKINEHIVQTQIMLGKLPFPRHLQGVPEIAGGHHEKMDGTGYPKGLKREEMSPVARMMAIADIFEALTAIDRPYKEGKTLSASLKIMAEMRDRHHIDPDLFDLFLQAGIYQVYAERFMRPEQVDTVDIGKLLSQPVPEGGAAEAE